jgi:hypothetical protein
MLCSPGTLICPLTDVTVTCHCDEAVLIGLACEHQEVSTEDAFFHNALLV